MIIKKFINISLLSLIFIGSSSYVTAMQAEKDTLKNIAYCPICPDQKIASRTLPCLHTFCTICLVNVVAQAKAIEKPPLCPLCRIPMFVDENEESNRLKLKLTTHRAYHKRFINAQQNHALDINRQAQADALQATIMNQEERDIDEAIRLVAEQINKDKELPEDEAD